MRMRGALWAQGNSGVFDTGKKRYPTVYQLKLLVVKYYCISSTIYAWHGLSTNAQRDNWCGTRERESDPWRRVGANVKCTRWPDLVCHFWRPRQLQEIQKNANAFSVENRTVLLLLDRMRQTGSVFVLWLLESRENWPRTGVSYRWIYIYSL